MNQPLKLIDRLSQLVGDEVILIYSPTHDRDFGAAISTLLEMNSIQPGTAGASYVFPPVENVAALAAIDNTNAVNWPDKWLIVVQGKGTYYLDRESTATANGDSIVAAPVGRWIGAGTGGAGGSGDWVPTTGGTFTGDIAVNGNVTATNFIKSSDSRIKERKQPLKSALSILGQVQYYSYFLKNSPKMDYGVIAQEVEKTLPHLVHTDKNGMKSVNYHALFVLMGQGLQELEQRVAKLEQAR